MSLDLSVYDQPEHRGCLTDRDLTRHADLYALTYLCSDNRALVAHLLQTAADLMSTAQTLTEWFLHDGSDGTLADPAGLTQAQRYHLLNLISTCAYNAGLYIRETQHRPVRRADAGWDPITTPITA